MNDTQSKFRDAIRATGLEPPKIIEPGKFHRFPGIGKYNDNTAGWCILFEDGLGGSFGDWSTGLSENWQAKKNQTYTDIEKAAFKRRVKEAKILVKEKRQIKQDAAAKRAIEIWRSSVPVNDDHPYLVRKCINIDHEHASNSIHFVKQLNNEIVLPIIDFYGKFKSLQFIKPDGSKRLLSGGCKTGCYIPVSNESYYPEIEFPHPVIITEGWATACTLVQNHPYASVLAAIDAGNLESVALEAREAWLDVTLIIAGDDDRQIPGNPGVTKARSAAAASCGLLVLPQWPDDAPNTLSDFNDLAVWLDQKEDKEAQF